MIDPKYADDITWLAVANSSVSSNMSNLKENIPPMLKKRSVTVNDTMTENFIILQQHPNGHKWRKCELLGSPIDTFKDIKCRKKPPLKTHESQEKGIPHSSPQQ